MGRQRWRPMYFSAHTLNDGTVLAAFPIRKPSKQALKQNHARIDPDGVARVFADAGKDLSDVRNETRTRFQDIISTNLNTRRAIRKLVLPCLAETQEEVGKLSSQLDRIEALLMSRNAGGLTAPGGAPTSTGE